jgi:hypothetical protein
MLSSCRDRGIGGPRRVAARNAHQVAGVALGSDGRVEHRPDSGLVEIVDDRRGADHPHPLATPPGLDEDDQDIVLVDAHLLEAGEIERHLLLGQVLERLDDGASGRVDPGLGRVGVPVAPLEDHVAELELDVGRAFQGLLLEHAGRRLLPVAVLGGRFGPLRGLHVRSLLQHRDRDDPVVDREVEGRLQERLDVAHDLLRRERAVAEDMDLPQVVTVVVGAHARANHPGQGLEQGIDLSRIELRHASPGGGC